MVKQKSCLTSKYHYIQHKRRACSWVLAKHRLFEKLDKEVLKMCYRVIDLAQAFTTLRSLSWLSNRGLTFMSHYVLCIHVSHRLYHSIVLVGIHFQLFRSLSIDAIPHSLHISLYLHTRTSLEYQHATFLLLAGVFIFLLQQNISRLYYIDVTEQSTKTYKHFYSC